MSLSERTLYLGSYCDGLYVREKRETESGPCSHNDIQDNQSEDGAWDSSRM